MRDYRKHRVWKTDYVPGVFSFTFPTWVLWDGWRHHACNSWDEAMRKARRTLRGE